MTVEAYPLQWPEGWPRTEPDERKYGRFATKDTSGSWARSRDITIAQAIKRINGELQTMDGPQNEWQNIDPDTIVISTNLRVRKADGGIASGQKKPDDPGAALYFTRDGKPQCIPCDSYTDIAQNLAGIAATLSALRALERHGSGLMDRAFTGFEALPDQSGGAWWAVLGVSQSAAPKEVKVAYQTARKRAHPDYGGSDGAFDAVQRAWREYQEQQ